MPPKKNMPSKEKLTKETTPNEMHPKEIPLNEMHPKRMPTNEINNKTLTTCFSLGWEKRLASILHESLMDHLIQNERLLLRKVKK